MNFLANDIFFYLRCEKGIEEVIIYFTNIVIELWTVMALVSLSIEEVQLQRHVFSLCLYSCTTFCCSLSLCFICSAVKPCNLHVLILCRVQMEDEMLSIRLMKCSMNKERLVLPQRQAPQIFCVYLFLPNNPLWKLDVKP